MTVTSKEIYSLLVQGYLVSEIRSKYRLTDVEYQKITARAEFVELILAPNQVSDLLKIKEIEENLFNLLSVKEPSRDVKKRISSLQVRYSQFLVK